MNTIRTLATVAAVALVSISIAAAAAPESKGGKKWKKGQGWDAFAATFDADKDGKVSKAEMAAKRPGFDHFDTNHDGAVDEAEVDALPAAQKNPKIKSWIARFDTNKDRKVTTAEWDAQRETVFDRADKNHDGFIDSTEATGDLLNAGSGA